MLFQPFKVLTIEASIMYSLKLFVTVFLTLLWCEETVFAINTSSGLVTEIPKNHTQETVQPKEILSLFSNKTEEHVNVNDKVVNNKSSNMSDVKNSPEDSHKNMTTTVGDTLVTPGSESAASTVTHEPSITVNNNTKIDIDAVSDHQISRESTAQDIILEGGGKVATIHPTTPKQEASVLNETNMQSSEDLSSEKIYYDRAQNDKDAEHKSSKIVGRKGVELCAYCPNMTCYENCKSPSELNSKEESVEDKNTTELPSLGNAAVTNSRNNNITEHRTNLSAEINPEAKKAKATKPLYTVDAVSDNLGNISVSQVSAKKLEHGNNYVVPVVGTILVVPLVVVLGVLMYKKGCEFWERRHYRRMDFLIDGMYND